MTAALVARWIVTVISAGQGIAPIFVDLNHTHATNPLWPGHARFHLVQQVFTLLLAAVVEVGLLWYPGGAMQGRFYVAALLTATPLAGFLVAALARPLYRGTLHDPNGIQPLRVHWGSRLIVFDMNVPIVTLATLMLVAAVVLFWFRG
jgi:hypothetical protein